MEEYPTSWEAGSELTFEEEVPSAPRPCKATLPDGRTAWVYWCDVAKPGSVSGEWTAATVKIHGVGGEFLGDFELTNFVEDLLTKVAKKLDEQDVTYSLVCDGIKLSFAKGLKEQGVKPGASLTLVKEPAAAKAGSYEYDHKSYPEDRFTEWFELELLPDMTCTSYYVTAGPGRTGTESTTHKDKKKQGHWSAAAGHKVVILWDGEGSKVFDLDTKKYVPR